MPDIKKNFGAGLAYLIDRHAIVQKDLAQDVGLNEQQITDYKAGRRKGNEAERARIAERLGAGLSEQLIRQLGFMIRRGVPGDEAFERLTSQASLADRQDETARFNRALDNFFDQIKEFLRDRHGESFYTAVAFEERMLERMPRFVEWKRELAELQEPEQPAIPEP